MDMDMDEGVELEEAQRAASARERVKKSVLADIERANAFY